MRLLLVGSIVLITLAAFENLAVTTIMPVVAADLDGITWYAFAMGVPLACHVAATAAGGIWLDARPLRGPFLTGIILFAAGLAVAGAAPSMQLLAVGRGISGLGTGLLVVTLYGAVGAIVPSAQHPRFFAAFSAAWVLPSLVGPPIAGYVAQWFSWRWVFLGVVPIILISLVLLRHFVSATRAVNTDRAVDSAGVKRRLRSALVPAVIVAVAIATLQGTASSDSQLWLAAVAFAVVIVFLPRLLPAGSFRLRRGLPSAMATRLFLNGTVIALEAYLVLYLQRELGWEAGPSGLVITVGSITWALGSFAQARVLSERARNRMFWIGALLVTAGTVMGATVMIHEIDPAVAIAGWGVAGFGTGLTYSAMAVIALHLTPRERHGEVSGSLQIADAAGAALSIAVFGALFTALLGSGVNPYAPGFAMLIVLAALATVSSSRVPKLTGSAGAGVAHSQ